jgi:pimeloyl-ACP methyl ester carboxylesterase
MTAQPVLLTHHFHMTEPGTGHLMGALSDVGAERAQALIEAAGQPFTYLLFPEMGHSMHRIDPQLFATTVIEWVAGLG